MITDPGSHLHGLPPTSDYFLSLHKLLRGESLWLCRECPLLTVKSAFKHLCHYRLLVECLVDSLFRLQSDYFGGSECLVDFPQFVSFLDASL